jgi:hypothetical protein
LLGRSGERRFVRIPHELPYSGSLAQPAAGPDQQFRAFGNHLSKEASSFSEEKEAKRLFPFAAGRSRAQTGKSFLVLFFKKEQSCFLFAQKVSYGCNARLPFPSAGEAGR